MRRIPLTLLAIQLALSARASGFDLPDGGFKGKTAFLRAPDAMALLIKRDPKEPDTYWAVLAEYDRLNGYIVPDRLAITRWVPRLFAYRVDRTGPGRYAMRPLRVNEAGDIVTADVAPDSLALAEPGTLDGAVLIRYEPGSIKIAERIVFNGRIGSTWEGYIAGKFFGTSRKSGGAYFSKETNTILSPEGDAEFATPDVHGRYKITERAPGLYTLLPTSPHNVGNDRILGRIGVFIDIVNWKPVFTTDELLLINPADPTDVGFFYERH